MPDIDVTLWLLCYMTVGLVVMAFFIDGMRKRPRGVHVIYGVLVWPMLVAIMLGK